MSYDLQHSKLILTPSQFQLLYLLTNGQNAQKKQYASSDCLSNNDRKELKSTNIIRAINTSLEGTPCIGIHLLASRSVVLKYNQLVNLVKEVILPHLYSSVSLWKCNFSILN